MSRFDYLKYDTDAQAKQADFKRAFEMIENAIGAIGEELPEAARGPMVGRYKALAMTAIEEAYAWVGKALRDEQVARQTIGNVPTEAQEERTNS